MINILISKDVADKIWELTWEHETEWLGILNGKRVGGGGLLEGKLVEEGSYIINSIDIPPQTNTMVHTQAEGPTPGGTNIVGWVHSHNSMEAYFSKEDFDNFKLPIAIVVNKEGKAAAVAYDKDGKLQTAKIRWLNHGHE